MKKRFRSGYFRFVAVTIALSAILAGFLAFSDNGIVAGPEGETGVLERMIVAKGRVTLDVDLSSLTRSSGKRGSGPMVFDSVPDSFFSIAVFNNEFRSSLPGTLEMVPQESFDLPGRLRGSFEKLMIERTGTGSDYELVVRDAEDGYTFFNIEGHEFDYDPASQRLVVKGGRVLLADQFAEDLGLRPEPGKILGGITIEAVMRSVEITQITNGSMTSNKLPAMNDPETGTVPGPDVIVGDIVGLAQFGSASGTQVGLAVGTDSCNAGTVDLNWFANPSNDHPVIPQNLYRMRGGADNTQTFEQIGQSSVKHAFTALTQNLCGFGCNGVGGSRLGSGCSDPYSASLNSGPNLGSRAWINPFTGFFPRNDSATPNNNHTGHNHTGTSHRILTEINDLNTNLNPGATYYAEGQYVTPHEYAWCQANPTQCNMYNNVSYRRYNVTGTASPFSFSPVGATVRMQPAVAAWTGATLVQIHPAPLADGVGIVAYKVSNPSAGVWQYEYVIYNQNLDRAIQSFSVPVGAGANISAVGFHAPPQHPGWSADGTAGNTGFSSTPWTNTLAGNSITWNTETFAQNENANAIRWGTAYTFRFTSNRPPELANATVGFFKRGDPIQVQVLAPSAPAANVSISGRVMSSPGVGARNALVMVTDSQGTSRMAYTGTFGYYIVENIVPGATYTVSAVSKGMTFQPVQIQVNQNITGLDFISSTN